MQTLTLKQAVEYGLTVVGAGIWGKFVAAPLPDGFDYHTHGQEVLGEQFEKRWENPEEAEKEGGCGYCVQVVEDSQGRLGLPGTRYIVRCYYSPDGGIETWTFYAALKVTG